MTDTTDIKALRKRFGNTLPPADIAKAKFIELLNGPSARSWFLAPYAIALLDLLEAERQRAAGSEEELHKALHREKAAERKFLAAQEEIAELKGDQVPYAYSYNYAGCETCEGFQDWRKELSRERPPEWMIETGKVTDLVELFTAQQKPVVPMALFDGYQPHIVRELQAAFKAAIEAAGGIVKDGE
ncbi:MAG: hypothetical protein ACREXO_00140 [Advenella sp.]